MLRSLIIRFTLALALMVPGSMFGQDTLLVAWTGTPGNIESTIMGDTTAEGVQAHAVYLLEANKVYLQLSEINLYSSCAIVGADPGDGEHPATIQPIPGDDGASQFTGWPQNNFKTYGYRQKYEFKNLLMNGAYADQSSALFGVMATYGERNEIWVVNVTSVHNSVITYFNFGRDEVWFLYDNTAVQYTCYPAGMYFGGFWWGAGAWGGTVQSLVVQNNTIEGVHGEGLVIWDNGPRGMTGRINHNTFVNVMDWPKYYRGGNNTLWTNNLFVNTTTNGQTRNPHGFGPTLNHPGGQGVMSTLSQGECTNESLIAHGNCWDNNNRNIHYANNVWYDTDEFAGENGLWNMDPWCWDVTDTAGVVTTYCDTMLTIAEQSKWTDDSTTAQAANGVTEANNIHGGDGFAFALDPAYMNAQIARTMDWLDNQVHDTYTTYWWTHQADENYVVVEWPLPMDFGYSGTSAAATHCTHGGPVGSSKSGITHDGELGVVDDVPTLPSEFVLNQNYPNPFNPTTEISFSMDKAADISLTIFNVLGQTIKVLEKGSLDAGTHVYRWDGRDEFGQMVATGVYLYSFTDGSRTITKKMALMK